MEPGDVRPGAITLAPPKTCFNPPLSICIFGRIYGSFKKFILFIILTISAQAYRLA